MRPFGPCRPFKSKFHGEVTDGKAASKAQGLPCSILPYCMHIGRYLTSV
jgi:hypothetical protein